jgi:peroxiredoxin
MARTPSTMRELGSSLPLFVLPDTATGETVSSEAFTGQVLVVAFICNHCPFVVHLKTALSEFGRYCDASGARMVAISSNDVSTHPDDSPELMKKDAQAFGYTFPYLYDESQAVAKAFDAACTPDFFVFDRDGKLAYRGQFDDSRPGNGKPITGADLRAAVAQLLAGGRPAPDQKPSIGCNIKWRS